MAEKTELAVVEDEHERLLQPVASTVNLVEAMRLFEEVKRQLLVPDRDTYTVEGTERIRKSGWRKLALAFGVSDEIVREDVVHDTTDPTYLCVHTRVKAWARGGRTVEGTGTASSRERKFAHLEHDLHALAHTRAKSRAIADMLGSSDLVAEETEEPEQPAPKAPTPTPTRTTPPRTTMQKPVDAGQRAIMVKYLETILGEDLVECIDIDEIDGELLVKMDRKFGDTPINMFISRMMKWGHSCHETAQGVTARLTKPKAP